MNQIARPSIQEKARIFLLRFYTFGQEHRPQKGETHDPYLRLDEGTTQICSFDGSHRLSLDRLPVSDAEKIADYQLGRTREKTARG